MPLFPESASTTAGQVDTLFIVLLVLASSIALVIAALIIYFGVKYRRRSEDEIPEQREGSVRLELAWTVIPLGVALFFYVWAAKTYVQGAQPPADTTDITVVAKQWMWEFQHAGGQRELNEVHVPVGRPIKFTMISQDVIHSLFIPDFRVKQDVLPGRYTTLWFQVTTPGKFHLFCTQYCGTSHANMTAWVIALPPAEFEAWLQGGSAAESPATAGAQLFQRYGCNSCHRSDVPGRAPALEGVYGKPVQLQTGGTVIADDAYLHESIINPEAKIVAGYQPIMPSFRDQLSEDQILQIIAYIKSLSGSPPAGGSATVIPGTPTGAPTNAPASVPFTSTLKLTPSASPLR